MENLVSMRLTIRELYIAEIIVIKAICLKFLLFSGLAEVFPKVKPSQCRVCSANGTESTLNKPGMTLIRLSISKRLKLGPQSSARNRAGIAFQPKYTMHKTLAACGR